MTVKKSVTVKFNSTFKTGTNNNANYYIDWSAILKNDGQQYNLSFTYVAQANTITMATLIASVYINIYGENYMASSNVTNACTTLHIGNLINYNNNLFADTNINSPIYLHSRPTNNNINIQILSNDINTAPWMDNAGTPVVNNNYILTLTFTEI